MINLINHVNFNSNTWRVERQIDDETVQIATEVWMSDGASTAVAVVPLADCEVID